MVSKRLATVPGGSFPRGDLVEPGLGINGEGPDPAPMGKGDVFFLLDGVAERQARRIDAEPDTPVGSRPDRRRQNWNRHQRAVSAPAAPDWPSRQRGPGRAAVRRSVADSGPPSCPGRRQERRGQIGILSQKPADRFCWSGCPQPAINLRCAHGYNHPSCLAWDRALRRVANRPGPHPRRRMVGRTDGGLPDPARRTRFRPSRTAPPCWLASAPNSPATAIWSWPGATPRPSRCLDWLPVVSWFA
jgi:hypothetical protein